MPEVDEYTWDLDRARAAISSPTNAPPKTAEPLAGVTLIARVQRRVTSEERMEVSPRVAERMRRAMPDVPADWSDRTTYVLVEVLQRARCTMCAVRPGYGPCPRCTGTGSIDGRTGDAPTIDCPDCDDGYITCLTCDGTREVATARVARVDDEVLSLRYTYLPSLPGAIVERVAELFDPAIEPPECLRIELDLRLPGSPYREVERSAGDTFFGHRFLDAIENARQRFRALVGEGVVRDEVHAYARPFFYMAWDDEHVVVARAVDGGPTLLRA